MNSKNKILVGCLALLLALSVGYALFSDTITINGTATAKGSFDITATCETGVSSVLGTSESLGYIEGGYENDTCLVVDDEVTFKTDFLYPGARRLFTVKYTNTGTIAASHNIMSGGEITKQICVANNIEGENQICRSDTTLQEYFANIFPLLSNTGNGYAMEDSEGNLLSEEEFSEFYDAQTYTITLKPGYSVYLVYNATINHSSPSYLHSEGEMFVNFNTTIKLIFTQATN